MSSRSFLSRVGVGRTGGTISTILAVSTKKDASGKSISKPILDPFTGLQKENFNISGYNTKDEFVDNIKREYGIARGLQDLKNQANAINSTGFIELLSLHEKELDKQLGYLHIFFMQSVISSYSIGGTTASEAISKTLDSLEAYVKAAVKHANDFYPLSAMDTALDNLTIKIS